MTELQAILKTWRGLNRQQRDAVLATVVHVSGSAYRRPGARLLLAPDGRRVGSVSGGCLEGEIARKAWWWTESMRPSLQLFDTTSEDDAIWGFGLGCNGIVQVLLERAIEPSVVQLLEFLETSQRLRQPAAVATVVRAVPESELRLGQRLLVAGGKVEGALATCNQTREFVDYADGVLRNQRSEFVHCDCADLFIEYVAPTTSLVILGAGYDARPLVVIAKELGFCVTVTDARPAYLRYERFRDADEVVLLTDDDVTRKVRLDSQTAVVLMTHSYQMDARFLPSILSARPRYVGLLGPRARAERLFAELGTEMLPFVHAPVGLDLGGESPAAVALSIIAEIQAVFQRRSGTMLKQKRGAIHESVAESGLEGSDLCPGGYSAFSAQFQKAEADV